MLMIFDGHHALHRAYHAHTSLTYKGEHTGILFGFLIEMQTSLLKFGPKRAVVVFDSNKLSDRRMSVYPQYKGNRRTSVDEMTEEDKRKRRALRKQLKILQEHLHLFGLRTFWIDGREGDDVIHLVSRVAFIDGEKHVTVVSADKDLYQLVRPTGAKDTKRLDVWSPPMGHRDGKLVTRERFVHYTDGISYNHFLMAKAIDGDTSDNIPGVPQVGAKTIRELMENVPSKATLKDVIRAASLHPSKRVNKVALHQDTIERNLEMMDISRERWTKGDRRAAHRTLKRPIRARESDVMRFLLDHGMRSLTDKFSFWVQPFRKLR